MPRAAGDQDPVDQYLFLIKMFIFYIFVFLEHSLSLPKPFKMVNLSNKQKVIVEQAKVGHNLLILGQAGTGKSHVVKHIVQTLKNDGKKVAVTGSTGMAASHYPNGTTYHRWSGLRDGSFTNHELLSLLRTSDEFRPARDRILSCDVLIISEISMTSKTILEQLEFICRSLRNNNLVFGGIQVIGEGDFLQLPPVPSGIWDHGEYCFQSEIFSSIFPHIVKLDEVFRQDQLNLINAVRELSLGEPSQDTENLLKSLSRPLVPSKEPIVRLCSLNYDVNMYNRNIVGNKTK